jgi:hypothetical protein
MFCKVWESVFNTLHHLFEYMGSIFKDFCLHCQPMTDLGSWVDNEDKGFESAPRTVYSNR